MARPNHLIMSKREIKYACITGISLYSSLSLGCKDLMEYDNRQFITFSIKSTVMQLSLQQIHIKENCKTD
jgi:hypothetical protein